MKLSVPDMSCGHCVATITKAVQAADPAATVAADVGTRTVQVQTKVPDDALLEVLANAGYPARVTA